MTTCLRGFSSVSKPILYPTQRTFCSAVKIVATWVNKQIELKEGEEYSQRLRTREATAENLKERALHGEVFPYPATQGCQMLDAIGLEGIRKKVNQTRYMHSLSLVDHHAFPLSGKIAQMTKKGEIFAIYDRAKKDFAIIWHSHIGILIKLPDGSVEEISHRDDLGTRQRKA